MGDGGEGDVVFRRLQSGRRVQVPVQVRGVVCICDVKNGPRWWCELREAQ
jgi:hypothetical protein